MPEVWLICETRTSTPTPGGSDPTFEIRVLDDLLNHSRLQAGIVVEGCGGEEGLRAVARYVELSRGVDLVATVQDRDYRLLAEAEQTFVDGRDHFMWRRHELENYALEPAVIREALVRLRDSLTGLPGGLPGWAARLPDQVSDIEEGLRECARGRAPVEAGCMTLWEIRREANQLEQPQFRMSFPTPDENDCVAAVRNECDRLRNAAATLAGQPFLDPAEAEQRYWHTLTAIRDLDYVQNLEFLKDFAGHELLSSFRQWLADHYGAHRLSVPRLRQELAAAILPVYETIPDLFDPDDFHELANGVRARAGLPPV